MNKQYFYLVAFQYSGSVLIPDKIFLQEYQAVKYGRKLATSNPNTTVSLYKQEITTNGVLLKVKQLKPYEKQEHINHL